MRCECLGNPGRSAAVCGTPRDTRSGLGVWLSFGALAVLAIAAPASALQFVVDSPLDQPDAALGDGLCASAGGLCTLRAALQEANFTQALDTITLPPGTFVLSIAGLEEFAASGDLDVLEDLEIAGAGAQLTVIDAGDLDRVLDVQPNASLAVRDLTLTGGQTTDAQGAGLRNLGFGQVLLERVHIDDNHVLGTATNAVGGGVATLGGSSLTASECSFTRNSADRGGAIFDNGFVSVRDSMIANNAARAGAALATFGTVEIERSTLTANDAQFSTITGQDQSLTLLNSTLSGNTGTGALVSYSQGSVEVRSTTIAFNQGSNGILLFDTATGSVQNSILWNPSLAGDECGASIGSSIFSLGNNVSSDGSCAEQASDLPMTDPLLEALADNGGPTHTHFLSASSPASDAGNDATCPAIDQRGVDRLLGEPGTQCDAGAVEVPEPGACVLALGAAGALAALRRRLRRRLRRERGRGHALGAREREARDER